LVSATAIYNSESYLLANLDASGTTVGTATDTNTFAISPTNIATFSIAVSGTTLTGPDTGDAATVLITGSGAINPTSLVVTDLSGFTFNLEVDGTVVASVPLTGLSFGCTGKVATDPVFDGFHGQRFRMKGVGGGVFNLVSTPTFQFNNRFVSLAQNDSMTKEQMAKVRSKHHRLIDDMKTGQAVMRPPVTGPWNHPGTYMGECGLKLSQTGSRLYVAPGRYGKGFAAVTLDGVAVPVSDTPIQVGTGVVVTRNSPFKVTVATPELRFTIVNADHFLNIEEAVLLLPPPSISGLLGQTADPQWTRQTSREWKRHQEEDFQLNSNDLWGNDFSDNRYVSE